MCLPVLQLRHGRRSGDAAPALSAEEGSDPPSRGLGTGAGPCVFSHAAPALQGSLPIHQSLAGRPSSAAAKAADLN